MWAQPGPLWPPIRSHRAVPLWLSRPGAPVPGLPSRCPIPRLSSPGSGSPVPPVPTHPGCRVAPRAAAGAGRSGGPCPPAAAPREPAPSAGGGSGRKPTPFGGGSAAEEMPLAALGPGRRGGEDEPPPPPPEAPCLSFPRAPCGRGALEALRARGTRGSAPRESPGLAPVSGGVGHRGSPTQVIPELPQ